jgi:hypothetical protein
MAAVPYFVALSRACKVSRVDRTTSLRALCSASSRGMPSILRRLRLEVASHHTAPRLHAQRPLHMHN